MRTPEKRRGFTLLELLVVMGVIAVLLGILQPQIKEARRVAKTMQCVGNYRTIGQTLLNYAADYESNLPKYNAYGQQWDNIDFMSWDWRGQFPNYCGPGSTDLRWILQGYVPEKYQFKAWQCPFIDGPPMGDLDAAGQNYRQALGSNQRIRGNINLPFSVTYMNNSAAPPAGADTKLIQAFINGGWAENIEGFPAKIYKAHPGLVLAQDAFWDVPWNGAGLMQISHLRDGSMQGHDRFSCLPGSCNNVVQGNLLQTTLTNRTNKGSSLGLGATAVFYDGSARFVPATELRQVCDIGNGAVGFRFWSILPTNQ